MTGIPEGVTNVRAYSCLVTLALIALPLSAQGSGPVGLHQREIHGEWTSSFNSSTPATEWKKGMMIGAGVGALVTLLAIVVLTNHGFGDTKSSATASQIIGTMAIFTLLGGLIGAMIHKRE
jgi:hypothetical protein